MNVDRFLMCPHNHVVVKMTAHTTMFWQEPILTEVYWTMSTGRSIVDGYMYLKAIEFCRPTNTIERVPRLNTANTIHTSLQYEISIPVQQKQVKIGMSLGTTLRCT